MEIGKVTEISGEPFRFLVKSDRTSELYTVDLQSHEWQGECVCIHWQARIGPKLSKGERGPQLRCKHLRRAREYFLEMVLPKLAEAMGMSDKEPEKEPSTEYGRARADFLKRNPKCAVHGVCQATDIHHHRGRMSKLLLDQRFWIPVCRSGHSWIHEHPEDARKTFWRGLPLLCALGEWNTYPETKKTP